MADLKTTIPKGSWVLVTGGNGYLASQIIKQFLERGYKVRGTVRDLEKTSWLVKDVFRAQAADGNLEIVQVADLAGENAFDEAVKGVSAIIHVATIGFDTNPNNVLPQVVIGVKSIMESALKEPSVKEFVYTSSIAATILALPEDTTRITRETWNDLAVQLAWAPPPHDARHAFVVYAASKTVAEKAVWEFAKEKKPHFTVNTVIPASIMGEMLNKTHAELSHMFIKVLYDGSSASFDRLADIPGTIHTDIKDTALLHVAAVLDPEVKNSRLVSWGERCNWNDILATMRRLYPNKKFMDDLPNLTQLQVTADDSQPLALLKKWAGQDGWKMLEESVADSMTSLVKWYP